MQSQYERLHVGLVGLGLETYRGTVRRAGASKLLQGDLGG